MKVRKLAWGAIIIDAILVWAAVTASPWWLLGCLFTGKHTYETCDCHDWGYNSCGECRGNY